MDFRNNMQKVYVSEEEKEKFMEKLNRDVEVREPLLLHRSAAGWRRRAPRPVGGWFQERTQENTPPVLYLQAKCCFH